MDQFCEEVSMTIQVGNRVPEAELMRMGEKGPEKVSTKDVFGGKKVAFFALPGAFTPTCSAHHLPGYLENAKAVRL